MSYFPEYARLVNEALIRLDRSPAWLAQRLGTSPSTVSRWLNQGVRPHDPETVVRVADLLGLSSARAEFLAAAGYAYQEPPAEPAATPSHKPAHNLPAALSPFFGREAELERISVLLADPACRLLTIVGPGGVGKTRLALQAAARQVGRFADGVCVAFLAAVVQGELLPGEILRALNAPAAGADKPEQALVDYLRDKEMLLVLDNFEQLATSALFLPELLAAAPGLKLLVTSRERLRLSVEWLIPLEGLDIPAAPEPPIPDAPLPPEALDALETYSAIELFVHTARRVQPGFELTPATAPLVTRICRLLGGFPLALELAAGWVHVLPVQDVLAELERSSALLATALGDVPQRHRSMDAVFDHSWSLLTPREQSLLRQLSVFRGGFTRPGAEEVAGASIADLAALAGKSWLRLAASGRYDMHELVRQYCEQKLLAEHAGACGELPEAVYRRFCTFIAATLREALRKLNFQRDTFDEIVPELGNLQAAWRYAVDTLDSDAGKQIALGIWFCGDFLGWYAWAIQTLELGALVLEDHIKQTHPDPETAHRAALVLVWIRDAQRDQSLHLGLLESMRAFVERLELAVQWLQPGDAKSFWQVQAVHRRSPVSFFQGDYAETLRLAQQTRALYEDPRVSVDQLYGTRAGLLFFHAEIDYWVAMGHLYLGDYVEAAQLFNRCVALGDEIGESRFRAFHLGRYSQLELILGNLTRAHELAQEGLQLIRLFNDRTYTALLLVWAGWVAVATGDVTEARSRLLEGLDLSRQFGLLLRHLEALTGLGHLALSQCDIAEARQRFEEAVAVFRRANTAHANEMVGVRLGLAWTALAEGNLDEARTLFRQALTAKGCAAWETMDAIAGLARLLEREEQHEQAVEFLALVAAHPFTAYTLRQQAIQWLAELESSLPPDVHAARVAAGRARRLDATLAELLHPV